MIGEGEKLTFSLTETGMDADGRAVVGSSKDTKF